MALHVAGGLEIHDPRGPFQPGTFCDSAQWTRLPRDVVDALSLPR